MSPDLATELTELLAVDVSELSLGAFTSHMAHLERVSSRLDAEVLDRLASFDQSGAWQIDAAYDAANWLVAHTGTAKKVAKARVKLARQLRQMPAVAAALADGAITESHARQLARCVSNPRARDAFADAEDDLVTVARSTTADKLANKLDAWIERVDQDGAEPSDPQKDTLNASRVGDRVKINGDFGLDTGIPLLAAIEERADILFHRDKAVSEANPEDGLGMRTPGMRRAEALTELVAAGAGATSNPRHRDPLFLLHLDPQTMRDGRVRADSIRELTDGTVIPMDTVWIWRCGSRSETVLLDARRSVLFLGRTERYANRAQRRALAVRDRGCAVPGCDRPPEHCDAHHVLFWEDFGPTDIDNLILSCRHHHRMIHAGKLRVEMVDGVPRFFDSYDRLLDTGRHRPPQAHAA